MVPGQPGEPEAALSDKPAWSLYPPGRPGTGKSSSWLAASRTAPGQHIKTFLTDLALFF